MAITLDSALTYGSPGSPNLQLEFVNTVNVDELELFSAELYGPTIERP